MSFLTGASKTQANQTTAVSGLQIQSSAYGKAVPILYGRTRIAPNLIWYGDFKATPQSSSAAGGKGGVGGGGGGKGGGGSTQYLYSTSFEMALCEGPISGVANVYVDKNVSSASSLGMSAFKGQYGQAPWGYLVSQQRALTEPHAIPASPYQVTVNSASDFAVDAGVSTSSIAYTRVTVNPPAAQSYTTQLLSGKAVYTFSFHNAGAAVAITWTGSQGTQVVNATIPTTQPYTVSFTPLSQNGFTDKGVVQVGTQFATVTGTPGLNQYSVDDGVYTFNPGNVGQTVNIGYYTAGTGGEALGYSGIAYLAAADYQLGNSAQLPNHNFEVQGSTDFTITANGLDADPSLVIPDLLSNATYGAGFPASRFGDFSQYQNYCLANGLWISPAYTEQAQASSVMSDLATATNSAFVWSQGLLSLVPYGDEPVTGNGYSYIPPSTPLYDLTDDDFLPNTNGTAGSSSMSNDPVVMTRKRPSDAQNSVKLEALDRSNAYNPAVVEAKDEALINIYGLRQSSAGQAHMFCDLNAARLSAQLQLQRQSIRNVYQFSLDQRYVLLDPMDIVTLTDANLGLNKQWVRILEITENDDKSLSFIAEEYLQGTGSAPAFSFQQGQGFNADYNATPGDANAPVIFEPTAELAEALEVWIAASGGAFWGGCDFWVSTDDQSYKLQGRVTGSARTGQLAGSLPAVLPAATGQTIDQSNTLTVDLTESNGELLSGSQADAISLNTLCYVGGEFIAFQNALLDSSSVYDLSFLVRGAYDSAIVSHAAGEPFARLDGGIFKIPYTQDHIGTTLYIKLLSFNLYGSGQQQLADVLPYAYPLQGTALSSPLPDITSLRTSYVAGITQLAWDEVVDFRTVLYEVRKGSSWQGGQQLGRIAHPPFNVQGNGSYWVSAYSQPTAGLQVYSGNPQGITVGGAQIVSNVIASWDEAATGWQGTTSGTAIVLGGEVQTSGSGNVLTLSDYLDAPDILNYGGQGNGTYEIPTSHRINIGRVAPCSVIITWNSVGQHFGDNILTVGDFLGQPDILDFSASGNTDVYPEIALSQDGLTWGEWQKFAAGSYIAMAYKARMQLETFDPTVEAVLESFIFEVDVPDRDDQYVDLAVPSAGLNLTFMPNGSTTAAPFNGGPQGSPNQPHIQVTILDQQTGDVPTVSSVTLAGCFLQVKNAGVGVARSLNLLVQGY